MTSIEFKKNKQRSISVKKRLILHNSLKKKDISFVEILNNKEWFLNSNIVASFLSIKTEFSTNSFNNYLLELGKVLCFPVIDEKNRGILVFKEFKKNEKLKLGKFGVMEPSNNNIKMPNIIFVPCLAFDTLGFRLGYGGGYYDKTISYFYSINHNFLTVGLAYDDQKVDHVVHDHLDQKLDYILTEKQLYKTS